MNKKIGTNQNKFRSSTDVNNYNKFLLELDNKQIKVSNENKEIKENKEINCYVKNINQLHSIYFLYLRFCMVYKLQSFILFLHKSFKNLFHDVHLRR